MSVTPEIFDEHMRWISEKGYTTVSLDELADILEGKAAGPAKPLVITFDDNQRSSYEEGFPILQKYDLTATFYLVTNRLDNPGFILRDEVRAMADAGMDIQSHTMTHAGLPKLSVAAMDRELRESRQILEEVTGKPVLHIAYPLTMHNPTVRARTQEAGYRTGSIMDPRNATMQSDLFKLPRIMMTDDTRLDAVLP